MRATAAIAWRETRAAWRRLVPLLLCLAVGVAAIVSVGSFGASVGAAIEARSQQLLAADLQLSSSTPIDRSVFSTLASVERAGGATATIVEFLSVLTVPGQEGTLLAEVKAVGTGYPLYGRLETSRLAPGATPLTGDRVLAEASLLSRLGATVGGTLKLGETTVTIAGVIDAEPDRSITAIALGPRLLVPEALLPASKLLDRGSRATYRVSVRLPPTMDASTVRDALVREGKDTTVSVRTAEDAQSRLRRAIDQLDRFLVTIALIVLLLAGTGIALTIRIHLLQRLDALAVLRAIGASRRQLLGSVLLQALGLGLLGSLLGVGLGAALHRALPALLTSLLPDGFTPRFSWVSAGEGLVLGVATTAIFALASALMASRVSPLQVLRRSPTPLTLPRRGGDVVLLLVSSALFVGLLLLTIGSWQWGLILLGVLLAVVGGLQLVARGLFWLLRRTARGVRSFVVREGMLHPTREPRAAATVVTTLALGGLLVGTTFLIQQNLLSTLSSALRQDFPNLYMIGVRPEQVEPLRRELGGAVDFEPVVRARLYAVDGEVIQRSGSGEGGAQGGGQEGPPRQGGGREFGLTYRDHPGPDDRVVSGAFWSGKPASPEVSVEQSQADELGVGLGATLTFDVLGTRVSAVVTSVRTVDWNTGRPNYVYILSPGSLEGAPTTFFAGVRVPQEQVASIQSRVAKGFSNVSTFDASVALGIVRDVLGQIVAVVNFLALFVIVVGLVLFAGMVLSTRAARVRETVILRTVGAKSRTILALLVVEYALLGLVASLIAGGLAEIASYQVVTRAFKEPAWLSFGWQVGAGVLGMVVLAVLVGVLAARPILKATPLQVLREE